MKFYETTEHLKREIERKEKEIQQLRYKLYDAKIREFYTHAMHNFDTDNQAFLDAEWTLSFMGQTVELPNMAEVFQGITGMLEDHMDNCGIEYTRGCDDE